MAARARKTNARGDAKFEAELVFGVEVLEPVLELEVVEAVLVADLVIDVVVKLLVGDAVVVVRVLPEVVEDPNEVEPDAETLAAPPDNAICSL